MKVYLHNTSGLNIVNPNQKRKTETYENVYKYRFPIFRNVLFFFFFLLYSINFANEPSFIWKFIYMTQHPEKWLSE